MSEQAKELLDNMLISIMSGDGERKGKCQLADEYQQYFLYFSYCFKE